MYVCIVTFKSISAKERIFPLNSLRVDTEHFALQDIDKRLSFLTIYDAPFELSDLAIIKGLTPFCKVLHYPPVVNTLWPQISTTASAIIVYEYPSQSPAASGLGNIRYSSNTIPKYQPVINVIVLVISVKCVPIVCFNCECISHEAHDCPSPVLSCICKEEGHMGINCTYSWFCSTVSRTDEQEDVAV